jgi:putative spermidine/putrescine transport system substrate-binding protein
MKHAWKSMLGLTAAATLLYSTALTTNFAAAGSMEDLIAAAKKEGSLTTIALPHDWCGYGAVIDGFKAKYGLEVNELNPDAGSGDEIEAIKANKGNTGPQAPDVIDVGLSFGPSSKKDGLIQPYKVATWKSIPDSAKDADGFWYGDYYGVLAFEVNSDIVKNPPHDWSDLLKKDYANAVALAGDPRASNQAIQGVYAAGLSTDGGNAAKAGEAGLKFFAKLNKTGNFVPVIGKAASLAQGSTPIIIRWDYNALADRDTLKDNPKVDVVIPKTGVVAGVYVQAISAYAPHPNAAKLWMEYLYSDEGQLGWLKGYCHPIRFKDLAKTGNFVPVIGKAASLAQGSTPIIIRWDYNALADRDTLKDNPKVDVVIPKTGVVAGVYVQAISAYAPHPNAAKLWMEYLYSDEGQLGWLKGYCHPIRFKDLAKTGKIPQDVLAKLPPAKSYEKAIFPTLDEQAAGKEVVTKQWDTVVGANVK